MGQQMVPVRKETTVKQKKEFKIFEKTPEVTKMLLDLMRRFIKHEDKKAKRGSDEEAQPALYKLRTSSTRGWNDGHNAVVTLKTSEDGMR